MKLLRLAVIFLMILTLGFIAAALVDDRLVLGINPWIKPIKFGVSISIFLGTIWWILSLVGLDDRQRQRYALTFMAVMVVEVLIIGVQSARGTTSHFNETSPLNQVFFLSMGIGILINTLLVGRLAQLSFTRPMNVQGPLLWGVRFGLLVSLFAFFDGGIMIAMKAHTVGLPDGGPGLPLLNWSTRAGDLRTSHFLSLHALQALPLFGIVLARVMKGREDQARRVFAFGVLCYCVVIVGFLTLALLGRPIIMV